MCRAAFLVFPLLALAAPGPSLDERLAKWRPVRMPYDAAGLTARERAMVEKLVEAARLLDEVFWLQSDPAGYDLYRKTGDARLKRLLGIHGSRFDLLDENRPFVGTWPMPPGGALYPRGLTREEIERYCREHPEAKDGIYSPYTVVKRRAGGLAAVPYRQEYARLLQPMAAALGEAAALSGEPAFAAFLRLRAKALLTDDYYASDLAWLDLKNPRIDVIFAPYETYLDNLLGVKTSYGAAILIRDDGESRKLALYEKYIPEIQEALPLAPADKPSKRGHATPMIVAHAPFRAGDLRYGYQAVADNLPNDPRIHQAKGSKKIFFKNFLEARVEHIILPLARRLMRPGQAACATAEGYMAGTILHEIAHGLGPAFARVNGKQVDIREALGPIHAALEEAKADAVGMFGLAWLAAHGVRGKDQLAEDYASFLAGILRTLRFGAGEAHGRAEMMEFNYLVEQRAFTRDSDGRWAVDQTCIGGAIAALAKELLEIEATGGRARAEKWFARYDRMPPELAAGFRSTTDIPVDIEPIFELGAR